jgi:hypothetical protein
LLRISGRLWVRLWVWAMYDASNRKDIRRAEKDAARYERERIDYIIAAMSTRQGRVWFYDLLESCHCFNDPFTGNALVEAYSKGERNVGLRIFADIAAHAADDYILMMREANERKVTANARDRSPDRPNHPALGERPIGADLGWDDQGPTSDEPELDLYGEA